MPKRTFIPNLLRYRRTHGFLSRLKSNPKLLMRQANVKKSTKKSPMLGPRSTFCRRRERQAWFPTFP